MQRFQHSCLYSCEVIHQRVWPRYHDFAYKVFMFYLDLGEIDAAHKNLKLFSKNKFNWFSYADRDHMDLATFLRSKNIEWNGRATLLTNCRTFGYVFNPISFYFCFDKHENPVCAIAEVTNTHKERKLYLLDRDCLDKGTFRLRTPKYFYVSPFSDLDTEFEFIFKIPSTTMQMRVDDYKNGDRILLSALTGKRKELSDANLLLYGLRFPFITLQVILLIYWQALKLRLKGLPFWKKKDNMHLQRNFITTTTNN